MPEARNENTDNGDEYSSGDEKAAANTDSDDEVPEAAESKANNPSSIHFKGPKRSH